MSSAVVKALYSPAGAAIEIVKWKVRKGSKVDPGSVLMTYKIQGNTEIKKLKSQQIGGVVELLRCEGDTVQPRQQLLKLAGCSHNIVIKELCAECGKDLREESKTEGVDVLGKEPKVQSAKASVAMVHSVPELVVTDKHAEEIGKADLVRLRKSKKLVLLVDLDQTLIHTTTDNIPNNLKGAHHFRMGKVWYHTKFRPGTESFLHSISKLYELHIVTFGVREYAHTIARIMDKEGKYFSHRILSRDELLDANTKKANLKSLFPCGEDMVAIIDDREDVWSYSDNVIPVLPYKFFTGTGDINAPNKQPSSTSTTSTSENQTSNGTIVDVATSASTPLTVDTSSSDVSTPTPTGSCTASPVSNSSANNCTPLASPSVKRGSSEPDPDSNKKQKCEVLEVNNTCNEETVTGSPPAAAAPAPTCGIQTLHNKPGANNDLNCKGTANDILDETKQKVQEEVINRVEVSKTPVEGDVNELQEDRRKEVRGIAEDLKGITERLAVKADELEVATVKLDAEGLTNITTQFKVKVGEIKDIAGELKVKVEEVGETTDKKKDSEVSEEVKSADKEKVEVEWADDDTYLQRLTNILVELHSDFYSKPLAKSKSEMSKVERSKNTSSKTEGQTVAAVLAASRKQVLEGCVLAFSGLFPQSQSLYHSTAYAIATKLGAKVTVNVEDDVTHLIASRLGTKKVRQAATNENCTVVHPDWLWLTWYNLQRQNELRHLLTKSNEIPEPPKSSNFPFMCGKYDPSFGRKRKLPELIDVNEEEIRKVKIADVDVDYQMGSEDDTIIVGEDEQLDDVEERMARRRFSDTLNPLMTFDNADICAMDAEIDDACEDISSSEGSDDESNREKELRKKVLSSDENESDSEESLSNDYPKGWGPKHRRQSSTHDAYDELPEEDYMHIQEAAENSPMEINSSDDDEEDSLMAAQLDKAFLDL